MAFSVTVTSSKIDVTSGTGTLAELYVDAIAASAGCMTTYSTSSSSSAGTSVNVYEVQGNRELELSNGVTLSTTEGDVLQWDLTANMYPVFEVATGAIFNVAENTTIIGDVNNTHQSYMYFYGETNFNGTLNNEIVIKNYRTIYIFDYGVNQGATSTGLHTWDHVMLKDVMVSSGHSIYFRPDIYQLETDNGQHSFTNITADMSAGPNSGWGQVYFDDGDYSSFIFNNWNVIEGNRLIIYGASNLLIEDSTFTDMLNDCRCYHTKEGGTKNRYDPVALLRYPQIINQNQAKVLFKNCTFDGNDNGVYAGPWLDRGGVVWYEDCTFQNATYGSYANRGIALYTGTTTFNSITTNRRWTGDGTHLHAYKLTLNVADSGASPIADAVVQVRQKEGREYWQFTTDSSGNVVDPHGNVPWLIYREETSTNNFTDWSNGTGNVVHVIEVMKDGYAGHSEDVVMNQDRTVNITLQDAEVSGTTLNNVTINSTATIY